MMDKVREALEEKLGAARKRLTDLTISEIMDTSLVDAFDLAADAAREALAALQEAGEAVDVTIGFASFKDGTYEVIFSRKSDGRELLLKGSFEGKDLDEVDQLLPTCVFVPGRVHPSPAAIRRERERCAKMADAWERPDALRLAAGEMTAQEMRTARAVAKGIAAAIRSLPDQPPAESSPGDAGESAKQPPPVEAEVEAVEAMGAIQFARRHVCSRDRCQESVEALIAALRVGQCAENAHCSPADLSLQKVQESPEPVVRPGGGDG